MGTEFEKLMRLAEQNTVEIQRTSLEKRQFSGNNSSNAGVVDARERRDKRRRVELELERRIKQRETDNNQRHTDLQKRRRERQEAEKAEQAELERRRQIERRHKQRQKLGGSSGAGVANADRRDGPAPRAPVAEHRRGAAQPLSYDQLMRIASERPSASGSEASRRAPQSARSSAPALQKIRPQHPVQSREPQTQLASKRLSQPAATAADRSKRLMSDSACVRRRKEPPQPAVTQKSRSDPARDEKAPPSKAPKLAASAAPIARDRPTVVQKQPVRAAPEREIDRFGVRASSTKRNLAPSNASRMQSRTDRNERVDYNYRDRTTPTTSQSRSGGTQSTARARNTVASRGQRGSDAVGGRPRATNALVGRSTSGLVGKRSNGPVNRRREEEYYESESDSMDDFIVDDEEDGAEQYRVGSIRAMLGVRYHDVEDEDDDDMEVSAMQLMREDMRSAKFGRLEDDEEERRLEEEERIQQQRRARRRQA
ncbi:hypothetical protein H4R24_000459 [Coemansia sp. RSA 988]|nr:hypothetical protein H4R24_000459 [Coemansia sp. RSA 988]